MHELNLLPPMRRLLLQQENIVLATTRLTQRIMIGLIALSVCGAAAGGVLWFTLKQSSPSIALQQATKEYQDIRSTINLQNSHLEAITKQEAASYHWSVLLPGLFEVVPVGVTIQKITVDEKAGTIILAGQASTRGLLVSFQDRLQSLSWVSGLSAPPSNLLEPINSFYTFTLQLKPGGSL